MREERYSYYEETKSTAGGRSFKEIILFEKGRFVNGKKLSIAELTGCSKIDCNYNKNGKCWNSNYSYDCGHRINKEVV